MMEVKIFSGRSVLNLSKSIAKLLNIELGKSTINCFNDGEINIQINENIRGKDIFLIQSTCFPVNDNLMELILMTDAIKRSSPKRITAVIPYFGYSRQDRKIGKFRSPITAKVIADILYTTGVNRILTIDLHSEYIQGFFNIPIDNISSSSIFLKDIKKIGLKDIVIVSPDIGGIKRSRKIAQLLYNNNIVIIDKLRTKANTSQALNLIGNVENKNCILIDDIIDTGKTLCNASNILKLNGAKKILSYTTHPVLSGKLEKNLKKSNIDEIVVCNTIPLSKKMQRLSIIRTIDISKIIAEAIKRMVFKKSLSGMFID